MGFSVQQFRKDQLEQINAIRAKHGVDPLVMDNSINDFAQQWAETIAQKGKLQHRQPNIYGENIAAGYPLSSLNPAQMWYAEHSKISYCDPESDFGCYHFTQLVWKNSKRFGMGVAEGARGMTFVVANFDPPGNIMGHFSGNVQPPQ